MFLSSFAELNTFYNILLTFEGNLYQNRKILNNFNNNIWIRINIKIPTKKTKLYVV